LCRLPTSRAPAANTLLEQQAAVHLPDVLRQVPQVLNPLSVAYLKLLQTVNKQCRLAVHHHVVNLTLCTHDTEYVADSLSQLIIGDWCRLQSLIRLELPYLDLSSVAICMLAKGNWPQLQHIDISGNVVTEEAISLWRIADWPELRRVADNRNAGCSHSAKPRG